MSEFAGNVFGTNENICVTASRGRLFVPLGREENATTKGRQRIILVCAAVLLVAVTAVAIWLGTDITRLPELDRLTPMVGQPVNLVEDAPTEAKYAGVPFTIELLTWNDIVSGFRYTYTGDSEAAARNGLSVAQKLGYKFGNPETFNTVELTQLTQAELARNLTLEEGYSGIWTWDLTDTSHVNLDVFNDSENWPGRVAGYLIEPAGFYLDLRIESQSDGKASIELIFEIRY